MTFGQQNTLQQSFQLLDKAFDSGINFFDSAEMYIMELLFNVVLRKKKIKIPYQSKWVHENLTGIGTQYPSVQKPRAEVRSILAVGLKIGIFLETEWLLLLRS